MSRLRALVRDAELARGILRRRPFNVLVQVTNRCNMRCSFCDFWPNGAAPRDELTVADYLALSEALAGLGTFLVSIEGGEPFVRPDLVEIVRAFARHHLPVLFTNGWYVDAPAARALFGAGLVHASVSIDYPDAERHDRKRGLAGATERAWNAVEHFRAAAPRGGRQTHVMTVLTEDNYRDIESLLLQTRARGVGHQITLLSTNGYRRGQAGPDRLPPAAAATRLEQLWREHPHLGFFGDYFRRMGTFLEGGAMPACQAGVQSFNIDHVGNVSPCIERIDRVFGNIREDSLGAIHARMAAAVEESQRCQKCWTACRGFASALGGGGSPSAWRDLVTRMRR